MPILDQYGRELAPQIKNSTFRDPEWWLVDALTYGKGSAGVSVNNGTAMKVGAVFACVRNISDDCAKLPLILYRRMERGKERATNNPLYRLLHDMPNPEMASFHFRQYLTMCACGPGNGYAEIVRNKAGVPSAMYALDCNRVATKYDKELGVYHEYQQPSGAKVNIPDRDMLHIHGPGDGVVGYSMIRLASETIGNAIAIDKATGANMGNDGTPGGVLKIPFELDDKARENLRKEWEGIHRGAENRRRTAVIDARYEFTPISFNQQEMQFVEQSKFTVEEIARWWRMPPHKIGSLDKATFSNIEHQALEYVQDCLATWLVIWEQEIARKLLPVGNTELFAEHLVEGLLRGDQAARGEFYTKLFNLGSITPNEIRDKENMNPLESGGDDSFVQTNLAPLEMVANGDHLAKNQPKPTNPSQNQPNETPEEPSQPADRIKPVVNAMRPVIADALRRCLKQSASNISAASKRSGFAQWRDEFFAELPASVTSTLDAPCKALGTAIWATLSHEPFPATAETAISTVLGEFVTLHVGVCAEEAKNPAVVKDWTNGRADREAEEVCRRAVVALGLGA